MKKRRGHRPGFSLIELTIALFIVATLAAFAMPTYRNMVVKARAAKVLGEFNAIRVAAFNYFAEHNEWPLDQEPGIVPPELIPYLPSDFTFRHGDYELDWENWILPDGLPKHPETHVLLGISVTTKDEFLAAAVLNLLGKETAHYTLGDNYTYVIQAL